MSFLLAAYGDCPNNRKKNLTCLDCWQAAPGCKRASTKRTPNFYGQITDGVPSFPEPIDLVRSTRDPGRSNWVFLDFSSGCPITTTNRQF